MKKSKDIDIPRLCTSIQRSRLMLRRYRENRVKMVREYIGPHYSEEGTRRKTPVNLLSQYVQIVGRNLIPKNPRVMLSTFDKRLKPTVNAMETWANKQIEHMKLQGVLQRAVIDSLFSVGIVKVALSAPAEAARYAWKLRAGQPFAEVVDLDDFVFEIRAHDFEEAGYIGHRVRVPLDVVKDSRIYGPARKKLSATIENPYNVEGDERVSTLGKGIYAGNLEDFEDMIDLWEIYLPRHRMVLTLPDDALTGATMAPGSYKDALREQNWIGPDWGPYHFLCMQVVPGNAMPKGNLQDLFDLHDAANVAFRKVIRMSERTKELTFVAGGATEDGNRTMKADDGDILRVDNPERLKQVVMGGSAIQSVMAVATVMRQLFNDLGGNLALLGGQGPQSKTAAQDEMLNQNAGAGMADMQGRTLDFTAGVVKSLLWYWHHDPLMVQRSMHQLQGLPGMETQQLVTPQHRGQVPFEDMAIQIDPYSLQHSTPQKRMGELNQVVQTIVIPMMQLLQQQGINFDINAYLQKVSKYMDMPDLADVVTISDPPDQTGPGQGGGGGGDGPMKPPQTTREYIRRSASDRTQRGTDKDMVARMLGHDMGGNPESNGQPQVAQ